MDEAPLKWIHTVGDKNVPASENFEIEKALKFAKEMGVDKLRGSRG